MKAGLFLVVLISAVLLAVIFFATQASRMQTSGYCFPGNVTPIFSPDNSERIFDLIPGARHEIKLEVYEFSSKQLADALVSAKADGVSIKVILEPSVYQNSGTMDYLIEHGIEANWASKKFHNTHSKFMIVDSSIVLVGSINWSENALKYNREASVIIYSKDVAREFEKIFDSDFNS